MPGNFETEGESNYSQNWEVYGHYKQKRWKGHGELL